MLIEIKVPSVGESVTEALLAQWFKNDGDLVKKDEPLFVIETDKVTLEVVAETDGVLSIQVAEGETVAIGAVVGTLDSEGAARPDAAPTVEATEETGKDASAPPVEPVKPDKPEQQPPEPEAPAPVPRQTIRPADSELQLTPAVRRLVAEKNLDPTLIPGTGPNGRITKGDVVLYLESGLSSDSVTRPDPSAVPAAAPVDLEPAKPVSAAETVSRKPMSPIRQRIAARLLEAKHSF
jgi:2-oxoglutarate dehydrogenase E2 component (dihydrolipoamide succinyltransferase)